MIFSPLSQQINVFTWEFGVNYRFSHSKSSVERLASFIREHFKFFIASVMVWKFIPFWNLEHRSNHSICKSDVVMWLENAPHTGRPRCQQFKVCHCNSVTLLLRTGDAQYAPIQAASIISLWAGSWREVTMTSAVFNAVHLQWQTMFPFLSGGAVKKCLSQSHSTLFTKH